MPSMNQELLSLLRDAVSNNASHAVQLEAINDSLDKLLNGKEQYFDQIDGLEKSVKDIDVDVDNSKVIDTLNEVQRSIRKSSEHSEDRDRKLDIVVEGLKTDLIISNTRNKDFIDMLKGLNELPHKVEVFVEIVKKQDQEFERVVGLFQGQITHQQDLAKSKEDQYMIERKEKRSDRNKIILAIIGSGALITGALELIKNL